MEKTAKAVAFIDEISASPGGEGVRLCIQCGTCTATCPSATRWEYTPSQVIAMIRAGMREEVLSSSSMWHCLSCYFCTVRCPRNVKPTDLFHALESVATLNGYKVKKVRTQAMYKSFVRSIQNNGRVHEFGMMFGYYLSTNPFGALKLTREGLNLFSHKRMPLLPKKVKGREDLSKISAKLKQIRGGQ